MSRNSLWNLQGLNCCSETVIEQNLSQRLRRDQEILPPSRFRQNLLAPTDRDLTKCRPEQWPDVSQTPVRKAQNDMDLGMQNRKAPELQSLSLSFVEMPMEADLWIADAFQQLVRVVLECPHLLRKGQKHQTWKCPTRPSWHPRGHIHASKVTKKEV